MINRDISLQGRPSGCPDRTLVVMETTTTEVNKHVLWITGIFTKLHYFLKILFFFFPLPAVCFNPSLNLKPLQFEVPGLSSDWLFTGREWLFQEMDRCLRNDDPLTSRGVVIIGNMGFGKTAIITRLVALSCHGNRMWPSTSGNQTMPKCKEKKNRVIRVLDVLST